MLIQSAIERIRNGAPGTKVTMPPTEASPHGATYHFKPTEGDPRHIAEVNDPVHVTMFAKVASFRLLHDMEATLGAVPDDEGTAPNPEPELVPEPQDNAPEQPPADATGLDALSDEELAAKHTELFGKPPRSNAQRGTIISKIEAKMAESH